MNRIYSDRGWIYQLLSKAAGDRPEIRAFLFYLRKFSWRCRKDAINLVGKDLLKEFPIYTELNRYKDAGPVTAAEPEPESAASGHGAEPLQKYKGLFNRLLDFAGMPPDFNIEFARLLKEFKGLKDRMAGGPDVIALKTRLAELHWQLYEVCFLKIIDSDLKGFVPGIMLHLGLLDEQLVTEEELRTLDRIYSMNLFMDETVPVMTLPYFLEKIYRSEINPSMTHMGEHFSKTLKTQERLTPKQREKIYLYQDTAEDRVRHEIRQVILDLSKILFGNKQKALPFLFSEAFMGGVNRLFLEPEKLASLIDRFKQRDFSLFYREVLARHQLGTDFVMKEVLPHFILYPTAGSRALLWQEIDGTRKDTPGRFVFPLFYAEKVEERTLELLGQYRWELQKTIAGIKWTDPVEGGRGGLLRLHQLL